MRSFWPDGVRFTKELKSMNSMTLDITFWMTAGLQ